MKRKLIFLGNEVDFEVAKAHIVSNLIKAFMRELPDPIIPYSAHDEFTTNGKLNGESR